MSHKVKLHFDYESASEADLKLVGSDAYSKHKSTRILMMAYAFEDEPVKIWFPHLEPLPEIVRQAFLDPEVLKCAWNCGTFERPMTKECLGIDIPIEQWHDPSVNSRYLSLPGGLDDSGAFLGLPPELLKDKAGKALIHLFCEPIKVRKLRGKKALIADLFDLGDVGVQFNDWNSHPTEWEAFAKYCIQDVVAEREIDNILVELPEIEREGWILDQKINERGMPVNTLFAKNALEMAVRSKEEVLTQIKTKTGVENPGSNAQILEWAQTQDYKYGSLSKGIVETALREGIMTPLCREVLTLRKEAAKTAYNKYEKILEGVCNGRMRNLFVYLGAARTGRWSSYGLQFQNLPKSAKSHENKLERVRQLILENDYETLTKEFGSVINAATSSIRSSFEAPEGHTLDVCDLSQIESRVLAWLAQCPAKMRVFEENRDTYLDFAAAVFNTTYDILFAEYSAGNKERRNLAKPGDLGCFGADTLVLTQERGWVPIARIIESDRLWDGVNWVCHEKVLDKGIQNVIELYGIQITPDHKINAETDWRTAWDIRQDSRLENQAINLAIGRLFHTAKDETALYNIFASVFVNGWLRCTGTIWSPKKQHLACRVLTNELEKRRMVSMSDLANTLVMLLTDWLTDTMPSYHDAEVPDTPQIDMPEDAYVVNSKVCTILSSIASPLKTSITPDIKSTVEIIMGTTLRVIFDSLLQKQITETKKNYAGLNTKDKNIVGLSLEKSFVPNIGIVGVLTEKSIVGFPPNESLQNNHSVAVPTYDILNSGPNHRFTILTNHGPLIVHNCGYGLGGGREEKNKDGDLIRTGLWGYAENMGVTITKEFAHECVKKFREKYPEIPILWQDLDNAARKVLLAPPNSPVSVRVGVVTFDRLKRKDGRYIMRILLPSGRHLHYMNARIVWQDSKLRTYDNESGETLSYYSIACADCGCRSKIFKPEEDSDDAVQKEAFVLIDASQRAERFCRECGCFTSHKRAQHQAIIYDGIGHGVGKIGGGYSATWTYGGKLTENIVQAISRDILLHGMMLFDKYGGIIIGHVHDEIIALRNLLAKLAPDLEDLKLCMETTPSWANGLILGAEGYTNSWYRKG